MTHRLAEASDLAAALLRRVLPDEEHASLAGESLSRTPDRMVKALADLLDGYGADIPAMLTSFPSERPSDGAHEQPIVIVRGIGFASLCEHHVLPFTGAASVAYVPRDRIVGLSKIPRVVRAYSRRLQVQERLTNQIADALAPLDPIGVMVVVRGRHTCCAIRGAESDVEMVTSAVRGCFRSDASARAEALMLLGEHGGR